MAIDMKGRKRFIFDVPSEWHTKIKLISTQQNKKMQEWICEAIQEKFDKEKELGW